MIILVMQSKSKLNQCLKSSDAKMPRPKSPKPECKRNGLLKCVGSVCFDLPCGVSIKSERTLDAKQTNNFYFPKGSYD